MEGTKYLPGGLKKYWIGGKLRPLPRIETAIRRSVDVQRDPNDFLCCMLGSLGFSTTCIQEYTKLSPHQISYRLKKGQVSRAEFRNGKSIMAKQILKVAPNAVAPLLNRSLIKAIHAPPQT